MLLSLAIFLPIACGALLLALGRDEQAKAPANAPSYTKVFAESLIQEAREDDRIVAITAAMVRETFRPF